MYNLKKSNILKYFYSLLKLCLFSSLNYIAITTKLFKFEVYKNFYKRNWHHNILKQMFIYQKNNIKTNLALDL